MDLARFLALAFALAFLSESLVEYLFGKIFDHIPAAASFKWLLMYISAAVGVGLAFHYRIDLIAWIAGQDITDIGILLSGLVIGRGANYLHQFVSKYFPQPEENLTAPAKPAASSKPLFDGR